MWGPRTLNADDDDDEGNKRCGRMARLSVPRWPTSFICWLTLHTEAAYKHNTLHRVWEHTNTAGDREQLDTIPADNI